MVEPMAVRGQIGAIACLASSAVRWPLIMRVEPASFSDKLQTVRGRSAWLSLGTCGIRPWLLFQTKPIALRLMSDTIPRCAQLADISLNWRILDT